MQPVSIVTINILFIKYISRFNEVGSLVCFTCFSFGKTTTFLQGIKITHLSDKPKKMSLKPIHLNYCKLRCRCI